MRVGSVVCGRKTRAEIRCLRDVVTATLSSQIRRGKARFGKIALKESRGTKKSFRKRERGPKTDKSGVKTDKNGKIRASQRRSPNRGKGDPLKREEENLSGNKRFSEKAENVDRES